jgi:hypothetical protein
MAAGGEAMTGKRAVPLNALRALLREPSSLLVVRALKALVYPPPPVPAQDGAQLALWVHVADGLPPRPWRLYATSRFHCFTLAAEVEACRCVARQRASEVQKTQDSWRGQASEHPSCVTERCAQGRAVREALDPSVTVTFKGTGPGGRFTPARRDVESLARAKARQRAQGLLEEASTIDGPVRAEEG